MDRRRAPHRNHSIVRGHRWRVPVALAVGIALAVSAPVAASGAKPSSGTGAPGIGDDYYPLSGNGGYDVKHYGLDISYAPATDKLTGLAVITAKATQGLTSFDLDLEGLTVKSVTVNGKSAAWARSGGELKITPKKALRKNVPFVTTVRYSGVPETIDDNLGISGFIHTDDGAVVAGQPMVAATWFPANDHPADKALYSVRITVPKGVEALSNGRLVSKRDSGSKSVWLWNTDEPMASYLATATIGQFEIDAYKAAGIRYWDAIDPDLLVPSVAAHTGTDFAYSGQADDSYKRLQRTLTVPADDAELSFWVNRDTEQDWDFAFLEVLPEDGFWRTIPDEGGILVQDAGGSECSELLGEHPFLTHYLSEGDGGPCNANGFWAASGSSDGWEKWVFDLSAYAGQQVDVSISYVSDYVFQWDGVSVDDIEAPGGAGTTSFEDDGDALDGWTVPGAPEGSAGNATDWTVGSAGPPTLGETAAASFARQPEIVDFLEGYFGEYPFDELGGIVDDLDDLGFALENQTRPIYSKDFFTDQARGDSVVVHEIAHQWFGDSVALERWQDIWLNEGFASYAEWLWSEHEGFATTQDYFDFFYNDARPADDPFWHVVIGDPGPDALFDDAVYERGAMTLHALRTTIGDDAFFELLPAWHDAHERRNATTAEFIALAEDLSGQDLGEFFDTWLYTGERPAEAPDAGARSFGSESTPKLLLPHGHDE